METISFPFLAGLESIEELETLRAGAFALAVYASPFARLLGCYKMTAGNEVVAFEARIEVPQYPVVDIRSEEPIAVSFDRYDVNAPEVLMLRDTFPLLPHRRSEEHTSELQSP